MAETFTFEEALRQPKAKGATFTFEEVTQPKASLADKVKQGAGDVVAGAVRGAGSIGATLLAPVDAAARALGVQNDFIGRTDRRQAMDEGLRTLGADPESMLYKGGKLGAEIAGTAGVGSAIAVPLRAVGVAPALVNAIATSGMNAGAVPGALNMATRMVGGGITGAAAAGLIDPEYAATGGAVGAALPPVVSVLGKVGHAIGSKLLAPEVPEQVLNAAAQARDAGYVIPPTQVKPTLGNRLLEGFSGKITTAQNASARNQGVTNELVKKELGLPSNSQLSLETLDALRQEAGKAYGNVAKLGAFDASGANLPGSVSVQETVNPLLFGKSQQVDAAELVRAWKQANHDATAYYRAFERDANPETLAKAKSAAGAAKEIDAFIGQQLENLGKSDMAQALKEARVQIAKTYSAEKALNPVSGNVDAKKLASMLEKGKPLSGGLQTAAEFASQFPKAAQVTEKMGSLPQMSPIDFGALGAISAATSNPMMMLGVLARPAARSMVLSDVVQNGLASQATENALLKVLSNPASEQLLYRSAPALTVSR